MKKKYYSKKHKVKKGKKTKLHLVMYSLLVICVISSIGYFTRYDSFEFNTINVSGVEEEYQEQIRGVAQESLSSSTMFWLISRGTPLTYNKKEIKERLLKEFPKIDRIIIKSGGSNQLNITVSERGPYSLWCTTSCYLVDIEGIAFEEVDPQYIDDGLVKVNDELNIINLGDYVVDSKTLDEIKGLIQEITNYGYVIDSFNISTEAHYDLVLDSGTILKFTSLKDIDGQMLNFKAAFSEKNGNLDISGYEYIDLRFENRVYTKERGIVEEVEETEEEVID